MTISLREAAAASGGRIIDAEHLPAEARVSTDTRTLAAGDVYVALRGEAFDGHAFVADAVAAGARAIVVDDASAVPPGVPALVVADTTAAYLAFAGVARRLLQARVIAVTGSAGKTTTKHVIARILERADAGTVVATHANENNEIGVAKLFLGAPIDAAYVVTEFGARHFGEIAPLARVARPDVAVLTNIGDAHLEIFGSPLRLAQTKWGIFATGAHRVLDIALRGCEPDGVARTDDAHATYFDVRADAADAADAVDDVDDARGSARVTLVGRERVVFRAGGTARAHDLPTHVTVDGEHNVRNVAAAAAAAFAIGIAPATIARALRDLDLPAGRYERIDLGTHSLVYDGYNASMDGTLATLASFARETATRRIAVLGSMAELGPEAPAMHARVGEAAACARCAFVLVGGDFADDLARGARVGGLEAGSVVPFASNAVAIAWLQANLVDGDLVLLKASRRYRMEEIVAGLRDARANDEATHA